MGLYNLSLVVLIACINNDVAVTIMIFDTSTNAVHVW